MIENKRDNIIVTGVPRSGTTLVCALLNNLENTICLREPEEHVKWLRDVGSADEYVDRIKNDFQDIRDNIKLGKAIFDRSSVGGEMLTNYFPDRKDVNERRKVSFEMKNVDYQMLKNKFTLATKHNVEYASVLPELIQSKQFLFICPIRNPISTILSWNTLATPVSQGAIPMSRYYWPEVNESIVNVDSLLHRQVIIFDMFCKRFYEYKNDINVVFYEDLLKNQNGLSGIVGRKQQAKIELTNKNKSIQYDWGLAQKIYLLIKRHAKYIHYFYQDSDLRALTA